jgi:ribosomal protein L29
MGIGEFVEKSEAKVAELKREKSKPKVTPIQELLSEKTVRRQIAKILKAAKQREAIATINTLLEESDLLPEIKTGRYKGQKKKVTAADLKKAGILKSK